MTDNLAIKGIQIDEPKQGRRLKPRGKVRKSFTIEYRFLIPKRSILRWQLNLEKWGTWGRYTTAARRDQAYAFMVKKEKDRLPSWGRWEYRKRDD